MSDFAHARSPACLKVGSGKRLYDSGFLFLGAFGADAGHFFVDADIFSGELEEQAHGGLVTEPAVFSVLTHPENQQGIDGPWKGGQVYCILALYWLGNMPIHWWNALRNAASDA